MGEAIVVTSGKGGVGKSTTSCNIGVSLALSDKKVCLVDTDIGLRNLDVLLGLENRIVFDLVDVIEENCLLSQALIKDQRCEELYLLPSAQAKDKSAVSATQINRLISQLKEQFDYVIVDCPAGIERGFKNAIRGAERAIVVTTAENTSVRDADRVIGLLEKEKIAPPKLIINRLRPKMIKNGGMMDIDEVTALLAIDLLGVVPEDEEIIRAGNLGEPLVFSTRSPASRAFYNIARRIQGESIPLLTFDREKKMVTKMKKWLGFA